MENTVKSKKRKLEDISNNLEEQNDYSDEINIEEEDEINVESNENSSLDNSFEEENKEDDDDDDDDDDEEEERNSENNNVYENRYNNFQKYIEPSDYTDNYNENEEGDYENW